MKYFKSILVFILMLAVVSCKKDSEQAELDLGYDYYPDEIGHYIIYQVDSTTYDDFFRPVLVTKRSLQVKEKIVEQFLDNTGRTAKRVERYERDSVEDHWTLTRTYYFVKSNVSVEKVEENLRFVSFVFPPGRDKTWKGNRYIEAVDNNKYLADWEYKITESGVAANINGVSYPSTTAILLRDRETQIEKTYAREVYAAGVGMVYKEWWHLEAQSNFDKPWLERAERGFVVKMQAISHGVE